MTILLQKLSKPVYGGNWDVMLRDRFRWSVDCYGQDKKGPIARVGSFMANHWFWVARGKTDRQTLANAKRHLTAITRVPCTFEYVEE